MAEPELPPAEKNKKEFKLNERKLMTVATFTISGKPERYHSDRTTKKALFSDQLATHGKRLHISRCIPHVDKLHEGRGKHMIIAQCAD